MRMTEFFDDKPPSVHQACEQHACAYAKSAAPIRLRVAAARKRYARRASAQERVSRDGGAAACANDMPSAARDMRRMMQRVTRRAFADFAA
jgi:hypothetical protein